jgi:hypothetical protein
MMAKSFPAGPTYKMANKFFVKGSSPYAQSPLIGVGSSKTAGLKAGRGSPGTQIVPIHHEKVAASIF